MDVLFLNTVYNSLAFNNNVISNGKSADFAADFLIDKRIASSLVCVLSAILCMFYVYFISLQSMYTFSWSFMPFGFS